MKILVSLFTISIVTSSFSQVKTRLSSFPNDQLFDSSALTLHPTTPIVNTSFMVLDPQIGMYFNSSYPRGFNDGATWKGKGLTMDIQGGIAGKVGKLSYVLYPTISIAQNLSFNLSERDSSVFSAFRYPLESGIDLVERYGNDTYFFFHPGQSEIKLDFGTFVTSIGTQNYSLGPSYFNPILLSQQGAGFPHIRIGTDPFHINIGKIETGKWEFNYIIGLLQESNYFDRNNLNDVRYINGISIAYQPKFLPQLTLGFNKILYKNIQFFEPFDLLSPIYIFDNGMRGDTINTNDTFDQLASISMAWNFPKSGFKAYFEYAKNDFSGGVRSFLVEPEHSRAYTIGFEKTLKTKKNKEVIINYEHTNLSLNSAFLWRDSPTFYIHTTNLHGYTNNGQIVGAGIGPGGNSDHLGIRIKTPRQMIGFLIQRIEANRDYFLKIIQDRGRHDVEYSLGFNLRKHLNFMSINFESIFSYNFNRYFEDDRYNIYFAVTSKIKLN